jgi:hypothetical protein
MFRDGFGLDIPKLINQSNQLLTAMYQKSGGQIAFDITCVSREAAKRGLKL